MKTIIPKLILIIFGLWLVFGLATQSGKFKPLPDYPDGYLSMELEEKADSWLADDWVTILKAGAVTSNQVLVYSSDEDHFYWKNDE